MLILESIITSISGFFSPYSIKSIFCNYALVIMLISITYSLPSYFTNYPYQIEIILW